MKKTFAFTLFILLLIQTNEIAGQTTMIESHRIQSTTSNGSKIEWDKKITLNVFIDETISPAKFHIECNKCPFEESYTITSKENMLYQGDKYVDYTLFGLSYRHAAVYSDAIYLYQKYSKEYYILSELYVGTSGK